jgi:hypothetical protein
MGVTRASKKLRIKIPTGKFLENEGKNIQKEEVTSSRRPSDSRYFLNIGKS